MSRIFLRLVLMVVRSHRRPIEMSLAQWSEPNKDIADTVVPRTNLVLNLILTIVTT